MTPEERSHGLWESIHQHGKQADQVFVEWAIAMAIRAAIEAECEACAQTVETMPSFASPKDAAAVIRARATPQESPTTP